MKQYRNEGWLRGKYWEEELSTSQIAKECKVHCRTIQRWLGRFNILRRPSGEAFHIRKGNHCNLSQGALEWIDGELLGDGNLCLTSSYSASFNYSSKYLEYIEYVSNTLESFGIEQSGEINKRHHVDRNMDCYSYSYGSLSYAELLPIRKQWYPNGKKIVPRGIKLTPLICRQWYIGDGSLLRPRRGRAWIDLCTDGFSISDIRFLWRGLGGLNFRGSIYRCGNSFRIYISSHSIKDFLKYIGKCPVECYKYKWAINRTLEVNSLNGI